MGDTKGVGGEDGACRSARPVMSRSRIFLLSPAHAGGKRAQMTLSEQAQFEVAFKLRSGGAPIGEVFSFISGLYFRGKIAYSRAFASPPPGVPGTLVIMAGRGLMSPESEITIADLREIADVPVDAAEPRYREPLELHARDLAEAMGTECEVVLLGSVASSKYVEPLLAVFGERLLFPADFVGRGDMSRGALMLRCARENSELAYLPVLGATLRGSRPPKLSSG